jgi:hypothetical protein
LGQRRDPHAVTRECKAEIYITPAPSTSMAHYIRVGPGVDRQGLPYRYFRHFHEINTMLFISHVFFVAKIGGITRSNLVVFTCSDNKTSIFCINDRDQSDRPLRIDARRLIALRPVQGTN